MTNNWKQENDVSGVSENVMLGYFFNVKKKELHPFKGGRNRPRSTLKLHENIDISQYGLFRRTNQKIISRKKQKPLKESIFSSFFNSRSAQ